MAEKSFGVKEVNLIGASGTPTITSPNNLNLNAVNVAISTNVSIGGTLSVTGNISIGGTLTYEDVTNIDSVGIVTAREGVFIPDNKELKIGNTASSPDLKIYHNSNTLIENSTGQLALNNSGGNISIKATDSNGDFILRVGGSTSSENAIVAVHNGEVILSFNGNSKLTTTNTGVTVTGTVVATGADINGDLDVDGTTNLDNVDIIGITTIRNASGTKLYEGVANGSKLFHAGTERLSTELYGIDINGTLGADQVNCSGIVTASTFSGSGASLTNLPLSNTDVQVLYTVTANGSSAYRFAGNGIVSTEDNPDVYLIRGLKYRFVNNSGGSHPFQIRQSSGGSAYSSGVTNNGASSGNIDFQVPYSAPSHLYYQCTAHGGMVGNLYIRGAGGQNTNVGVTTFSGDVYLGNDIYLTDGSGGYEQVEVAANDIRVEHKHIHSEFDVWVRSTSVTDRKNGIVGDGNDLLLYSNTTSKVRIASGGDLSISDGNLVVASGHGIDFSATGDGSGTDSSELLDDYEEGSWSPAFKAGNNSTASPTTVSEAKYTKIGRMVHVCAYFTMSSYASGTTGGDTRIVGLPYVNIGDHGAAHVHYFNGLNSNVTFMSGTVQGSSYEILIRGTNSATSSTSNLDFDNHFGPGDSLIISATYYTT